MRLALSAAVLVLVAWAIEPESARGQGRPPPQRVLLLQAEAAAGLLPALSAELRELGFVVRAKPHAGTTLDAHSVNAEAREQGVGAVLLLGSPRHGVQIWLRQTERSELSLRETVLPTRERGGRLMAIRVAEALRAALKQSGEGPARAPLPGPPARSAQAKPSRAQLGARLGGGAAVDGLGVIPQLNIGAFVAPSAQWILGAGLASPLFGSTQRFPEGQVNVQTATISAGFHYAAVGGLRDAAGALLIGSGAAVSWSQADAEAVAPYEAHDANLYGGYVFASLGCEVRVVPRAVLDGRLRLGYQPRERILRVRGEDRADAGALTAVAMIGLRLTVLD